MKNSINLLLIIFNRWSWTLEKRYYEHIQTDLPVTQNGYLYIYVSNETPNISVYFDDLQVTHIRGPLLEETHYYPFGLTMTGISSSALSFAQVENKYRFNSGTELSSKEYSDGGGLDWYDTYFRRYDLQIGRFTGKDPLSAYSSNESPYNFVVNNPIRYVDPLGLDTTTSKVVNGRLIVKKNPEKGDVLKIINEDGKISYYTYNPDSKAANSAGYVGSAVEQTDENVTVTGTRKREAAAGSWYAFGSQANWIWGTSASIFENVPGSYCKYP